MSRADLSEAVAVVTGASSGIGVDFARQLVERGCGTVWLVARRKERLEALAAELGPAARVFAADLSTPEGCQGLIDAVPRVDVLINNAGLLVAEFFEVTAAADPAALTRLVDVNCRAMVALCAAWTPGMVERQRGWVLNVGSIAGDMTAPLMAIYGASKHFVGAFTEALGMELRHHGVAVSLLAPGPVVTGMVDTLDAAGVGPPALLAIDTARCAREGLVRLFAGKARTTPNLLVKLGVVLVRRVPLWLIRRPLAWMVPIFRRRRG